MTTLRSFRPSDLYKFNHINLDALTETYSSSFYMVRRFDMNNTTLTACSNIYPHGHPFVLAMKMQMEE